MQFESCKSDLLEIKTGIPQGSILGPLFFSILIHDIVNSSMKFSFLMYADDTTIYFNLGPLNVLSIPGWEWSGSSHYLQNALMVMRLIQPLTAKS